MILPGEYQTALYLNQNVRIVLSFKRNQVQIVFDPIIL